MPRKSLKRTKTKKDRTRNDKGILLEQIVAMLHKEDGVKVETNVFLTPKSGDETRKREIDVLLTQDVAGYPVRVAIQCKNYGKPINIGQVGEFKDLLEDVGIPHQHGIIVSVNGYQAGAESRAKELAIKTLILEGLDKTRLKVEIQDTFQFFVHLLLVVVEMTITSNIPDTQYVIRFWDDDDKFCGFPTDLIVSSWRNGEIPMTLGEHSIDLKIPQVWHQFFNRRIYTPISMSAKVRVVGYLAEMQGKLEEYKLKETGTNKIEKIHLQANFDAINNLIKSSREEPIFTEEELNGLKKKTKASIENRIRLPKIFCHNHLEPFSKKVYDFLLKEVLHLPREEINTIPQFNFEELEGDIFSAMVERAAMGEPVFISDEDGNLIDIRYLAKKEKFNEIIDLLPRFTIYPRKDFAEYLTDALLAQGEILLKKSLNEEPTIKKIIETEAFSLFNKVINISPAITDTYYDLGLIFKDCGFYDKSIWCLNIVISAQSQNAMARYALAETFFKKEDFDNALNTLNKAINEIYELPLYLPLFRAKVFAASGKYKDAMEDLVRVWKSDYQIIVKNRYWHKLVFDVYKQFTVLGLSIILSDIYLYYGHNLAKENSIDESENYLNTVTTLIEDIHKSLSDDKNNDFINDSFIPILSRADNILAEINSIFTTKAWSERLEILKSKIEIKKTEI